jgi:hypothetical protein
MAETIERKIGFYRLNFFKDDVQVSARSVFEAIDSISMDSERRYYPLPNGNFWVMTIHSKEMPMCISMATIRMEDLPFKFKKGKGAAVEPLELALEEGLYEPMHFKLFEDDIIGVENAFYAPRPTCLKSYVPFALPGEVDDYNLCYIFKREVSEMIHRMGEIKLFTLSAGRDEDARLDALDGHVANVFRELKNITPDAEEIEIILRPAKYSRKSITLSLVKKLPEFLSKPENRSGLNKLKITANDVITGSKEEFDLLEKNVMARKKVIKQMDGYRCVNPESMFEAIDQAYDESKEEIYRVIDSVNS